MDLYTYINNLAESLVIYFSFILIAKHVFLERCIRGRYKRLYYIVSILIIAISSRFLPQSWQDVVTVLVGLISLYNGRDKKKELSFLLFFPIVGIVDGLVLPVIVMPERLINWNDRQSAIYESIVFGIIFLIMIVVSIMVRIRSKQRDNHYADRELQKWERVLLCFVGVFQLFFSNLINRPLAGIDAVGYESAELTYIIALLGISSFVMTVIVIIVVLVGNKRTLYFNKVSDMQYNMITMMAEIVENRDSDTGGHIQRTARYVEIIAKQMKDMGMHEDILTDKYIENLVIAAPLHDIGKIHVSDVILNKPGRLTKEEYDEMKNHAAEGKKLLTYAKNHLGDFAYLDMAIELAGAHHEWWDGSDRGYPDNIAGEDIPLCARIMAVADVFDALTAKRCYKEPMPFNRATNIILEEKGTHFDPMIVEAFVAAIAKIKAELEYFEGLTD